MSKISQKVLKNVQHIFETFYENWKIQSKDNDFLQMKGFRITKTNNTVTLERLVWREYRSLVSLDVRPNGINPMELNQFVDKFNSLGKGNKVDKLNDQKFLQPF